MADRYSNSFVHKVSECQGKVVLLVIFQGKRHLLYVILLYG